MPTMQGPGADGVPPVASTKTSGFFWRLETVEVAKWEDFPVGS